MRALHVLFASVCVGTLVAAAVAVGCGGDDPEGGPATTDGGGTDSNVTPPGPGNDGGGSDGGGPVGQGLDPTFGTGGFFTWAHPTASTQEGLAIVRQSDGKLVAAGGAYFRSDYVDVVRFDTNGALDTTFGGVGTGHAIVGGLGGMFGMQLALAPDGKLLVLGNTNAGYQVMVARLDANGVIDTTWGTDGVIRFSAGTDQSAYWGVAVQSDGKVVVGGGYGADARVMRFGTDGKPDTTFGNAGATAMPSGVTLQAAIAIDSMGRILVGGNKQGAGAAVVRLTSAGVIDNTFDTDGVAYITTSAASTTSIFADGASVYVAGYGGGANGFLTRLDANGAPDVAFNGGTPIVTSQSAKSIGVDANGRPSNFSQYRIQRFETDGGPDTTLDNDGLIQFSQPSAQAGLVLPDTSMINVGMVFGGIDGAQRMGVAKRTPTGPDDTTFGDAGYVTTSFTGGRDVAISFEPTADGKTIISTFTDALSGANLLRVTSDGKLDTTFGSGGVVNVPFTHFGALAVDATGRALMLNTVNDGFILRRYDVAGNVDSTFGTADGGGTAYDTGAGSQAAVIGTHPDGRIVIAGTLGNDVFVHRLGADGTPDGTFGGGLSVVSAGSSNKKIGRVVGLADGTVLVGVALDGKPSIIRFGATGGPAAGFGTDGVAKGVSTAGRVRSVGAQPNGAFVVLATKDNDHDDYFIERFGADGKRDTTFATTGVIANAPALAQGRNDDRMNEGPDLAVDAAGKMYVATVAVEATHDEMAVFRYTADGQPDLTWGPNGRRVFTKSIGVDAARGIRIRPDGTLLVGGRMFTSTGASDVALAHVIP